MTANCMGAFGAYKQAYSRYIQRQSTADEENEGGETVWVTKRYVPTDLRVTAPVPRHKLLVPKTLPPADEHWLPTSDPPLRSFDRGMEPAFLKSQPSSRCEEYSTLRQMLPSRGSLVRMKPPNWGTEYGVPVIYEFGPQSRFPNFNSPMTRYVDDMHKTNKLFKLH